MPPVATGAPFPNNDRPFRYAQSQVTYTQPTFYSPLHTPQNWQIPSKRREVYQWLRYFSENEPKVAAALDFYSSFPMNGFETQCDDSKIKRFYDNLNKRLNLDHWCKMISREYYMIGDVFPFIEISCDVCKGSNIDPKGKPCRHKGGSFNRLVVLNPDWIDVQANQFAEDPVITLLPDDDLKRVVWHKRPKALYDRLPPHIRTLILAGKPIPLDNNNVSHLKYNPYPYGVYGTSIIRRLFKTLTYKDKLMTAQWIVAERLILPIRVVKVGDKDRPAGAADIADIQQQLAQTATDPNLTLVTHHAFDYDWIGCLSTEDGNSNVLTADGLKHFSKLTSADLIATWNVKSGRIEYQPYKRKIQFKYDKTNSDGHSYRIGNSYWDINATPNHRHYLADGSIKRSDELKVGDVLITSQQWAWEGTIPETLPFKERPEFSNMTLGEFCKFAGYYVAEGHVKHEGNKNLAEDKTIQCFALSQNLDSPCYEEMKSLCSKVSSRMWISNDDRGRGNNHQFWIANADLSRWMAKQFGDGSYEKKFPSWMMNLPVEYLRTIWDAMYAGDGNKKGHRYSTASVALRDQAVSMLMKFGYWPRVSKEEGITPHGKAFTTHRITWSEKKKKRTFRIKKIERIAYEGEFWCLETQNSNFFMQAGNQIILTGNSNGKVLTLSNEFDLINKEILQGLMINEALLSGEMAGYASAAIGAEALIQRMESWRLELARWIEDRIYKPIAQMRGFVDEAASEELGEPVWIYPKIKWNDLNLRDDTQQKQLWMQLHDKQVLSTKSLCDKFDLDYDMETELIRFETAQMGGQPGAPGGAAGAGGDMGGGMFGGGGGGGAPMGDMGAGGMGAAPGAPGADMGMGGSPPPPGGAPPMGGAPATAAMFGGSAGKVLSSGRASKLKPPDEEEVQPTGIRRTSLEQIMYKMIVGLRQQLRLPLASFEQFPLGRYRADFAFPQIKLAVECDGQAWHSHPDKKAADKMRDAELAKFGWTTVRFSEVDLKEKENEVAKSVTALIYRLWKQAVEKQQEQQQSVAKAAGSALDKVTLGTVVGPDDLMKLAAEPFTADFSAEPKTEKGEEADGNSHKGPGDQMG